MEIVGRETESSLKEGFGNY
jgi:hypothetical protein